jgi:hypothetical protein
VRGGERCTYEDFGGGWEKDGRGGVRYKRELAAWGKGDQARRQQETERKEWAKKRW